MQHPTPTLTPTAINRVPAHLDANAAPWMVNIAADGKRAATGAPHVAVLLPDYNLLVSALEPVEYDSWQEACEAAAKCDLLGFTDWDAGTVNEQQLLVNRERSSPAAFIEHFPHTPASGWLWTKSPWAPSPSVCAWSVNFGGGLVYDYARHNGGFVRPVRRLSSGQCLGLLAS